MNPILVHKEIRKTFSEKYELFFNRSKEWIDECFYSPIFINDQKNYAEFLGNIQDDESNIIHGKIYSNKNFGLPFKKMRILHIGTDKKNNLPIQVLTYFEHTTTLLEDKSHSFDFLTFHPNGRIHFGLFLTTNYLNERIHINSPHRGGILFRTGEFLAFDYDVETDKNKWIYHKSINKEKIEILNQEYGNIINGFIDEIRAVSILFNNYPNTHLALVEPKKESEKSIEWIKPRTHIVLLHKSHPANSHNIKEGSEVKVDESRQIIRMAHARRAHYRILRSQRWGKNQGKQIFVRQAWVGPKEWIDEGSKQIYRIVE